MGSKTSLKRKHSDDIELGDIVDAVRVISGLELILLQDAERYLCSVGERRINPIATGNKMKWGPPFCHSGSRRLREHGPMAGQRGQHLAEMQAGNSDSCLPVSEQAERGQHLGFPVYLTLGSHSDANCVLILLFCSLFSKCLNHCLCTSVYKRVYTYMCIHICRHFI